MSSSLTSYYTSSPSPLPLPLPLPLITPPLPFPSRRPRESIVGVEFRNAVQELNFAIPLDKQIRYFALDYTRASKGVVWCGVV